MLAAEKWYEYQTSYHRYGLDMRPSSPRKVKKKQKESTAISAQDKLRLMMLTVLVGCVCVCLILTTAYSAKVKYNINALIKQNEALQGEIENLSVAIKSANSIQTIEEKAKSQLGMIYPDPSQYVVISQKAEAPKDFALALKQQAYN